jgi:hypothetical protein
MSNTETTSSKAPTHIAHQARGQGEKKFWTRIGAAWPTKSGDGFNIQLDVVPLDGRIVLLPASEKKA